MKEASGELNMTVVTIILIAAIVTIATPLVKNMMDKTEDKACCMNNGGYWSNKTCQNTNNG